MNKILRLVSAGLTAVYAGVMAPLLAFSVTRFPKFHAWLVRPLMAGPFQGELLGRIQDRVYQLERGDLDDLAFIRAVTGEMKSAHDRGELDFWLNKDIKDNENVDIVLKRCFGYAPFKWWYLKLHFMAPGNIHGLHAHRSVISTQLILRGDMKIQEFDVADSLDNEVTTLKIMRDETVGVFGNIVSTDGYANVHGFEPANGAAVRFQFYLRGHCDLKTRVFPKRGRLYVHPDWSTRNGDLVVATIGASGRPGES